MKALGTWAFKRVILINCILMKTPGVLYSSKGSGQLLHTSSVRDGPPWGLYVADFCQEGHDQEVSSVNGGLVMAP